MPGGRISRLSIAATKVINARITTKNINNNSVIGSGNRTMPLKRSAIQGGGPAGLRKFVPPAHPSPTIGGTGIQKYSGVRERDSISTLDSKYSSRVFGDVSGSVLLD